MGEHHLVAGVEVGGHHPQGDHQVLEGGGGVTPLEDVPQALVGEEVVRPWWRKFMPCDSRPPGNTSVAVQRLPGGLFSLPTPRRLGEAAMVAPLNAPAEHPTITSGTMSLFSRARSMPTCATDWLPPPESTNAVRGNHVPDAGGAG